MLLDWLENYYTYKPWRFTFERDALEGRGQLDFLEYKDQKISYLRKNNSKKVLVILCHGNASNISTLTYFYDLYDKLGYSYISFDYPGYGLSPGKPSEEKFYSALDCVFEHVANNLEFSLDQVVLHGVSLGGAVAIQGLSKYQVACGVVDCSFTNNHDMGKHLLPLFPLYKFVSKKYNSVDKVKSIETPVLFNLAEFDAVVPKKLSIQLYESKIESKELYIVKGAVHNNYLDVGGEEFASNFKTFVEKHT